MEAELEAEKIRDKKNYFLLRSKKETGLLLFERRKSQLTLVFETWMTGDEFEDDKKPLEKEKIQLIIAGDEFTSIENENFAVFKNTDAKIKQLSFNNDFEYYVINAIQKTIAIQIQKSNGIYPPLLTLSPDEFDAIMQDENYAPAVAATVEAAWGIGAKNNAYLESLVK